MPAEVPSESAYVSLGGDAAGKAAGAQQSSANGVVSANGSVPSASAPSGAPAAAAADGSAAPEPSLRENVSTLQETFMRAVRAEAGQQGMQEAQAAAGRVIRQGAYEVRVYVQANPYAVTLMSFCGGVALFLVSVLNLINILNIADPLGYVLQLYQAGFGLIIIVIDGPSDKMPEFVTQFVLTSASFLHNNITRVLFYLFIACEQASQGGWYSKLVGWYFAAVAILYTLVQCTSGRVGPPGSSEPLVAAAGNGGWPEAAHAPGASAAAPAAAAPAPVAAATVAANGR